VGENKRNGFGRVDLPLRGGDKYRVAAVESNPKSHVDYALLLSQRIAGLL
jgi:hypothetical protein